jgi:antitoxin HicB
MNKKHIGSDFDDFLAEHGILTDAETIAIKRIIAYQVMKLMDEQGLTKTEMAERMNSSRASLNRLLDPANNSVTLQTLENAAHVLNKRLRIELI